MAWADQFTRDWKTERDRRKADLEEKEYQDKLQTSQAERAAQEAAFTGRYGRPPAAIQSELASSTTGYSDPTPALESFMREPMTPKDVSGATKSFLSERSKAAFKPPKEPKPDEAEAAKAFIRGYRPGIKVPGSITGFGDDGKPQFEMVPITKDWVFKRAAEKFKKVDYSAPEFQELGRAFDQPAAAPAASAAPSSSSLGGAARIAGSFLQKLLPGGGKSAPAEVEEEPDEQDLISRVFSNDELEAAGHSGRRREDTARKVEETRSRLLRKPGGGGPPAPQFMSEQEAMRARLPRGTVVVINGRRAVIE